MSLWGTYLEELLDVSFNGVSLQSVAGGQIVNHNFDQMPEIRDSQNPISSAHRSITASRKFVSKRANVNIAVAGEFHELQAIVARLRQLIQYKSKNLVLTRGVPKLVAGVYDLTETTQITFKQANVVDVDLGNDAVRGKVIVVQFRLDDPVGVGNETQSILNVNNVTTASRAIDLSTIDLQGTFQEQYTIYKITINSLTNGSNPTLSILNGLSELIIAQPFAATDVIIVDTESMRVTLNGELIDFSGSLPFITDPDSTIYINNTFTARNLKIEVTNNPRYI